MNVSKILLRIPGEDLISDPKLAIESICGKGVKSFVISDIILSDGYKLVTVERESPLSLYKIYYVDVSKIKPQSTTSTMGTVIINNISVNIDMRSVKMYKKWIPIYVRTQSSVATAKNNYYALIANNPLSTFSSASAGTYIGLRTSFGFYSDPVEPIYPKDFKLKLNISNEDMISAYKGRCAMFPSLEHISISGEIKIVTKYSDIKPSGTIAYIINIDEIPDNEMLEGVILVTSRRTDPKHILYWPAPGLSLKISRDELQSIKQLLYNDEISYKNYQYYIDVLNK